jgi:hypothetical protein
MTPTRAHAPSDGPERTLSIDDGRVACPRRGSVDIARCWACADYRGLTEGHIEALRCAASDDSVAQAMWSIDRESDPLA